MFHKNFVGKCYSGREIAPPSKIGKIVLIATTVIQFFCLAFAMCGHGDWVGGELGYSGLWTECKSVKDPYTYGAGTLSYSCYHLKMRDSTSNFNTARLVYILSHFFGSSLFILLYVSVIFLSDNSVLEFIKVTLAFGQWGLLMLGCAMITAVKNNEDLLFQFGSRWVYGRILGWFSWCLSCLVLISTFLFIILPSKLRGQ